MSDVAELQFPAKDPSAGQLAESVARTLPRADRALELASNARSLAIVAALPARSSAIAVVCG